MAPQLRRARDAQRRARAVPVPAPARASPACFALLAFGGSSRFVYLQVVQHEHYRTLAESNRVAIVPIVPNRGVITDRNGIVLAQSYSAYTLELTPSRDQDLDATIDELAAIVDIEPRDRKRFRKLLDESKNFESLPLRTRLDGRGGRALRASTATAFPASRSRRGCSASTRTAKSRRT
jgi:cell division protein FtsI/penicillin-binding protein 2